MTDLLERWEGDEARLRALGQAQLADFSKAYQAELREWWREWQVERLTLEEAAAYSGLAYDTLRKKVAAGELPNAGDKGRPRIQRGNLPMRPPGPLDTSNPDALVAHILAARQC
jgi:hypothetical protein